MKRTFLVFFLIALVTKCAKNLQTDSHENIYSYGNSTEYSQKSSEKIDNETTYEVYFSLEEKTDCITVDIESVYLEKSFPMQKIPKNTFFIIEKKIPLSHQSLKDKFSFVVIGRNFSKDWELFRPVKVCTNKNDPLSFIEQGEYRIRFTCFEKLPVYYIITINSNAKIKIPLESR